MKKERNYHNKFQIFGLIAIGFFSLIADVGSQEVTAQNSFVRVPSAYAALETSMSIDEGEERLLFRMPDAQGSNCRLIWSELPTQVFATSQDGSRESVPGFDCGVGVAVLPQLWGQEDFPVEGVSTRKIWFSREDNEEASSEFDEQFDISSQIGVMPLYVESVGTQIIFHEAGIGRQSAGRVADAQLLRVNGQPVILDGLVWYLVETLERFKQTGWIASNQVSPQCVIEPEGITEDALPGEFVQYRYGYQVDPNLPEQYMIVFNGILRDLDVRRSQPSNLQLPNTFTVSHLGVLGPEWNELEKVNLVYPCENQRTSQ